MPFCTRAGVWFCSRPVRVCQWVLALPCQQGARGERARRYSLPDLPQGDQLPAFLARSARPWQTPRHRRARVRRTPCAHMPCPAFRRPAAQCALLQCLPRGALADSAPGAQPGRIAQVDAGEQALRATFCGTAAVPSADPDGDLIVVCSDDEVEEALRLCLQDRPYR